MEKALTVEPQSPDPDELPANESKKGKQPKAKRPANVRLLALLGLMLLFATVNWPYLYAPNKAVSIPWRSLPFDMSIDSGASNEVVYPIEAGWPFRFYISHSMAVGDLHVQWFAKDAALNLLIALSFFFVLFLYVRRATRKSRGVALADLLIVVTLLAAAMGYGRWKIRQQELDHASVVKLQSAGIVIRQPITPKILEGYLPDFARKHCFRITAVNLQDPTADQVELVCQLPYLRSLRIAGGEYDLVNLRRLPSMRYLQDIRVAGQELDGQAVLAMADCVMVRQLNISQTNCGEDSLEHFAKLTRLSRMMAIGTMIPLESWGKCSLKKQLVELTLSRPTTGSGGKIKLESWPLLRKLALESLDAPLNPNVFEIVLHDIPKLNEFNRDAFQLADLDLQRLPELSGITIKYRNLETRLADNESVPVRNWVRNLVFKDLPKLKNVGFNFRDFESIEISGCDQIEYVVASCQAYFGTGDQIYDQSISPEICQRVIDNFGNLKGPPLLSIRGYDLTKVDLSPLKNNPGLKKLSFQNSTLSKTSAEQIGAPSLVAIDVRNANAEVGFVTEIASRLPALTNLMISAKIDRLRIEDKPNLRTIVFDDHEKSQITALRLINLPELQSPMVVGPMGGYLHVENVAKLPGLAILSAIPQVKVSGVQGLEWFVGGGHAMNDEVVSEVLKAKALTHLTIGFPSASEDAFKDLVTLKSLQQVALPGAKLSDDAIRQWEIPSSLTDLDVRECGLSSATIAKLVKRGNWKRLLLTGNELDVAVLAGLQANPRLEKLGIGGMELSLEVINQLAPLASLVSLNLSETKISSGGLAAILAKAPALRELDLTGATLDWSELQPIIQANKALRLKMSAVDGTVSMVTQLMEDGRLIRDRDPFEIWFKPRERGILGYDARGMPVYENSSERSDLESFARPDWPVDFFRPMQAFDSPPAGTLTPRPSGFGAAFGRFLNSFSGPQAVSSANATEDDTGDDDKMEDKLGGKE